MEGNQGNNDTNIDTFDLPNNVNNGASWPEKIVRTILFIHSGYVFLKKFGVDFTFAKNID